jgi:Fe-S-cluster-containing dehydrogenase component
LEIRWQGLRELRLRAPELKDHIDKLYRERSLKVHLRETSLFRHLNDVQLNEVAEQIEFESYGTFDWYTSYNQLAEQSAADRLEKEPIIAEEGHYPNGLFLVRAGFARMSQQIGHGHRTISYLGRGQIYGYQEIAHNWRNEPAVSLQYSLRALGYVNVLFVPTAIVEQFILPFIPPDQLPAPIKRRRRAELSPREADAGAKVRTEMLEFLVEERFINGTATMMINLDCCTRCDECVLACAATHGNNPRFTRQGKQFNNHLVADACMHCVDPVCMIGCPTGAIHRDALEGQVVINDATCIGCRTCANSCPYDAIRMVEIRDAQGRFLLDQKTHAPVLKATKCDLCIDQPSGPACERACPHSALKRLDMRDERALVQWLSR